jgi:hypothetical protein
MLAYVSQTCGKKLECCRGACESACRRSHLRDKCTTRLGGRAEPNREANAAQAPLRDNEAQERAWRREMLARFRQEKASLDFIYAFERTGNFITSRNRDEWSKAELIEWNRLLSAYHRLAAIERRTINLCFDLPHESGRSAISRQRRFVASEFGMAVLSAHEQGISSFAVEDIFRETWLDAVTRLNRATDKEWDPMDHHRFDYIDKASFRKLLHLIRDDFIVRYPGVSTSAPAVKLILKIEEARAADGSWFGKPPAPCQEDEREKAVVVDDIQNAIFRSEQEAIPADVIESMLLRSWIRMLVFNDREDERVFHILDSCWEEVHATFQVHMAEYSGLHLQ